MSARLDAPNAASEYLGFFRDVLLNRIWAPGPHLMDGRRMPAGDQAVSMAGQRRLDSFAAQVAQAVEDGVAGHVIETGTWRGGASFMAAKTLELMGDALRRVYLCDSFKGIPPQDTYETSSSEPMPLEIRGAYSDRWAHTMNLLNHNSAERVKRDAAAFGLDVGRLRFVEGFFNESIPRLLAAAPDLRFAVVRLDGDTFRSTYETIELLYPRLSDGGFLIVDDYMGWTTCRTAINMWREKHNVTEPIIVVPHGEFDIINGVYWRKNPSPAQRQCVGAGALRPKGYLDQHTRLVRWRLVNRSRLLVVRTRNNNRTRLLPELDLQHHAPWLKSRSERRRADLHKCVSRARKNDSLKPKNDYGLGFMTD